MADFINLCKGFFELFAEYFLHWEDGLMIIVVALGNLFTSLSTFLFFMPDVLGSIALTCFALIVVLRVIGR